MPQKWNRVARQWLFDAALPVWAGKGVDRQFGGFHEALDFAGHSAGKPKRTRTMARQIYSFAAAQRLGWKGPADQIVRHGMSFLCLKARRHSGGWVHSLTADGTILDESGDLYDIACILLAMAHAFALGHAEAYEVAAESIDYLDRELVDAANGGYFDKPGGRNSKNANPHMHLLEAWIAWYQVTADSRYLERAGSIVNLLVHRMIHPRFGAIREHFDGAWMPLEGAGGDFFEPGHHFEWAALVADYSDWSRSREFDAIIRGLCEVALVKGINPTTSLCYGTVAMDGTPIDRIARTWPQSEGAKAAKVLGARGFPGGTDSIEKWMNRLFSAHLDSVPQGLWADRINADGTNEATDVPGSILYHLTSCFSRYIE